MSAVAQVVRKEWIAPDDVPAGTYRLAPIDVFAPSSDAFIAWPLFFKYDIDAAQLIEALKKISSNYPHLCGRVRPDEDMRHVVEVDPGKEDAYGFPFEEWKADMSAASAILAHGQLKSERTELPLLPELPFFVAGLDIEPMLKGEIPLAKVMLTHLNDGCVLNVSIGHLLVDGRDCINLFLDLACAYRGEEFPRRDHDRSRMWPDQLAKHYTFLGDEIAALPRKASLEREKVGFPKVLDQASSVECFYLSKNALDKMTTAATPFLKEGESVNYADALVSLCWMLACEHAAEKPVESAADLGIAGTMSTCVSDMVESGVDVVPENYWGNSWIVNFVTTQGMEFGDKSLPEIFTALAVCAHQTVAKLGEQPQVAARSVMIYYSVVSSGSLPAGVTGRRASVTDLSATKIKKINFGGGAPAIAHIVPPLPMLGGITMVGPAPGADEGVLLYIHLTESQKATLKNSVVIKELAPEAKLLYSDFTASELDALLTMQD